MVTHSCMNVTKDVLSKIKYTLTVILACVDIVTDITNGISLCIFWTGLNYWSWYLNEALFVAMIASVWLPGIAFAFRHREMSWKSLVTAIAFPFQMIFFGLVSLVSTWSCSEAENMNDSRRGSVVGSPNQLLSLSNASGQGGRSRRALANCCQNSRSASWRQRFEDMKDYEVVLESTVQLTLNVLYVSTHMIPLAYKETLMLTLFSMFCSFCSLVSGLISALGRNNVHQKTVQLRFLGKLLITLQIASLTVSIRIYFAILFNHFSGKDNDQDELLNRPTSFICLIWLWIMIPAIILDELIYILRPTRQRAPTYSSSLGIFNKMAFVLMQPTIVDLRKNWLYYLPFLLFKLAPLAIQFVEAETMFQIVRYTCNGAMPFCGLNTVFDLCSYYSLLTIVGLLQLAFLIVPGFFFEYKVAEESAVDKLDGENEQGQDEHEGLTENVDVSESRIQFLDIPNLYIVTKVSITDR